MSIQYTIGSSWLSVCEKLSNLVDIWQTFDKNKLGHFWHTLYVVFCGYF